MSLVQLLLVALSLPVLWFLSCFIPASKWSRKLIGSCVLLGSTGFLLLLVGLESLLKTKEEILNHPLLLTESLSYFLSFKVDPVSSYFCFSLFFVIACQIYTVLTNKDDLERAVTAPLALPLMLVATLVMIFSNNYLTFVFGRFLSIVSIFGLLAWNQSSDHEVAKLGHKALILQFFSLLMMVYGVVGFYYDTNSYSFDLLNKTGGNLGISSVVFFLGLIFSFAIPPFGVLAGTIKRLKFPSEVALFFVFQIPLNLVLLRSGNAIKEIPHPEIFVVFLLLVLLAISVQIFFETSIKKIIAKTVSFSCAFAFLLALVGALQISLVSFFPFLFLTLGLWLTSETRASTLSKKIFLITLLVAFSGVPGFIGFWVFSEGVNTIYNFALKWDFLSYIAVSGFFISLILIIMTYWRQAQALWNLKSDESRWWPMIPVIVIFLILSSTALLVNRYSGGILSDDFVFSASSDLSILKTIPESAEFLKGTQDFSSTKATFGLIGVVLGTLLSLVVFLTNKQASEKLEKKSAALQEKYKYLFGDSNFLEDVLFAVPAKKGSEIILILEKAIFERAAPSIARVVFEFVKKALVFLEKSWSKFLKIIFEDLSTKISSFSKKGINKDLQSCFSFGLVACLILMILVFRIGAK